MQPVGFLLASLWLAVAAACQTPPAQGDETALVWVGKTALTQRDVERAIAREPDAARQRYSQPQARKQLLEGLVKFELMAQAAEAAGAMKDPEVIRAFKHQGIQKYIQERVGNATSAESISAADVQMFYDQHKDDRYSQPEGVHVRQHLFKDQASARAFFRSLDRGKAKSQGADLGFVDRNATLPPAIKTAALALSDAEPVSSPVKLDTGWTVLTLIARRSQVVVPLADVETAIRQELQRQRRENALDALIEMARRQVKVTWVAGAKD